MGIEQYKRQHRRYERQLARVIASHFTGQAKRIAAELRDFDSITVATIDQVFRVDDEHARFVAAIRPTVSSIMAESAFREWQQLRPRRQRADKAWGAELIAGLWDKLPRRFLAFIRAALDELEAQDYWQQIQGATKTRLTSLVRTGLADGDATPRIAKTIQRWLGGSESKARALAIARTETTGAMNSGHYATHQGLAVDGVIVSRVWRSIIDKSTRETHVKADEQTVKGAVSGGRELTGGRKSAVSVCCYWEGGLASLNRGVIIPPYN
ncbi:MAG: hypothetical protein HYV60_20315 [Planctomycetia bacterium]|nr:hypothetical protein [Planctomycetia bacterium]